MKKILVLLLAILSLCGCTVSKTVSPILDNILFTVNIDYAQDKYVADASIVDDTLNLVIREPEIISCLSLGFDENGLSAEFKGIKCTSEVDSLPQSAIIQVLYNVINDAVNKQLVYDDTNCRITGKVNEYKYEFVFSPSGLPLKIEIEDFDLLFYFSNVSLE